MKDDIISAINESDSGIRIKDIHKNEMWIPSDIIDFAEVEKLINEIKPNGHDHLKPLIQQEEKEQLVKYSEIIQNNLPIASLVSLTIILVSYAQLHFYYSLYDIRIYDYLNASEIIFEFANQWKESIVAICFFVAFHRTFESIKMRKSSTQTLYEKIKMFMAVLMPFLMLFVISSLVIKMVDFAKSDAKEYTSVLQQFTIIILCIYLVYSSVSVLYSLTIYLRFRERFVTMPLTFAALVVGSLLINGLENIISYKLLLYGYPKYKINLTLNDGSKITSSQKIIYIGSTSGYYFFKRNSVNLIVPKSSVAYEEQEILRRGL